MLVVRVPGTPSRHRVAVWRELRGIGALKLGQGGWVVPDTPMFADGVARAIELAARGEGEVLAFEATGRSQADEAGLAALFTAERAEEWAGFVADCGKLEAQLDGDIRTQNCTITAHQRATQSVERLRCTYAEIKARDVFGALAATAADQGLKRCGDRLAEYTQHVFRPLHHRRK